jgi:prepilin-type N-terminal cleavage/methylation domain-containing protein
MELKRNKIRNTQYAIRNTRYAFTLVEILIVVAILGILAAVTLPTVKDYIKQAKESAAKDTLRIMRNSIGLYAAQHNGFPPGYVNGVPITTQLVVKKQFYLASDILGQTNPQSTAVYNRGPYLSAIPKNPFNNRNFMLILNDLTPFPDPAPGTYGWIYKPTTKEIRMDWPGTDSKGIAYYDY